MKLLSGKQYRDVIPKELDNYKTFKRKQQAESSEAEKQRLQERVKVYKPIILPNSVKAAKYRKQIAKSNDLSI
jgi:hypothetical protein